MMKKQFLFLSAIIFIFIAACQSDYDKMVTREAARGVRNDSLFWTIKLNMPADSFFVQCLELNHQQLLLQGETGKSVVHPIKKPELQGDAAMIFYPVFSEKNTIMEMPITFQYDSYSPFKTDYNADKLLPDVLQLMEKWYGKGFIKIEKIPNDPVFAKIDGNRRILIRKKDDAIVSVIITDLTQKK